MSLEKKSRLQKLRQRKGFKLAIFLTSVFLLTGIVTSIVIAVTNPSARKNDTILSVVPTPTPFMNDAPQWWNNDFADFKQVVISNTSQSENLPKNSYVQLTLDHAALVTQNQSNPDASDFQVIYEPNGNTETAKKISFNVINSNTENTIVEFTTQENIDKSNSDRKYYLYFNNKYPSPSSKGNIEKGITPDYIKTVSQITIPHPFLLVNSRNWVIKEQTVGQDLRTQKFTLKVNDNISNGSLFKAIQSIDLKISDGKLIRLNRINNNDFSANVDSANFEVGFYSASASFVAGDKIISTNIVKFNVSEPLFVTWTIDWEGFDVQNKYLDALTNLSTKHGVPMTHFFNPRIYPTNTISTDRKKFLTDWVKNRMNNYNEEIGLHMHMFSDMVKAAGIEPKKEPDWGSPNREGYSVVSTAYNYDDFIKMIKWSKEQFKLNGLPEPKGYRAGGWYMNSNLLKAFNDSGFIYDSSGREPYALGPSTQKGLWNLTSTTKPYHPNIYDQNSSKAPNLNLWEFPDNGLDSTNHPEAILIQKFKDNYKNQPLVDKQILTYCTHPHWLNIDEPRLEKLFNYIDPNTAISDNGPVIYSTESNAYLAYK